MLYSRIESLEDKVGNIKAMSKDKKQYHKVRNKLGKGVQRAKRMEAAAQKVAVMKRRQLSIRTQNLRKFNDSVRSSSRQMQSASSMHTAQCTDQCRHPNISRNIDSKRKED